jgi:hypothetical protein
MSSSCAIAAAIGGNLQIEMRQHLVHDVVEALSMTYNNHHCSPFLGIFVLVRLPMHSGWGAIADRCHLLGDPVPRPGDLVLQELLTEASWDAMGRDPDSNDPKCGLRYLSAALFSSLRGRRRRT